MNLNSIRSFRSLAFAALLPAACFAQSIKVTPDRPSGVYDVGQAVRWSVHAEGIAGELNYAIAPGQGKVTATGVVKAGDGTVDYTFDQPSTVLVKVTGKTADGKEIVGVGGAVAGVKDIQPSAPRPDDFDAFWADKIKELRAVPANPVLTPGDAGRAGVDYAKLTIDNIRGTHVQAQVARPTVGEKFPAVLIVQWAGVYGLQKPWVTDRARDGWLALNIMPHELPIDQPEAFYKEQSNGPLKNYWAIGNDSRETSYYLRMYLSCVRGIDYLKSRPDWDGKTIIVMGGSQGGMQSLVTAGLCEDITAALADVPAGCDMLGPTVGRKGGWPQWYDWTKGIDWHQPEQADKVHEASRYFDVVNFASRIRCPVLVGTGLVDDVCPSAGVIAAVNQIQAPKELIIIPNATHQAGHGPYDKRQWGAWLPALLKGQPAPVATTP